MGTAPPQLNEYAPKTVNKYLHKKKAMKARMWPPRQRPYSIRINQLHQALHIGFSAVFSEK